jgi:hypothetical protein
MENGGAKGTRKVALFALAPFDLSFWPIYIARVRGSVHSLLPSSSISENPSSSIVYH